MLNRRSAGVAAAAIVIILAVFLPIIHMDVVVPSDSRFPAITCLSGAGSITYYLFAAGFITWVPNDYVSQGYAFQTTRCSQLQVP